MAEAKLTDIVGIGPAKAANLRGLGIVAVSQVATADAKTIAKVRGLSKSTARKVIKNARRLSEGRPQKELSG